MSGKRIKVFGIAAAALVMALVAVFVFHHNADSDVLTADASTARLNLPPGTSNRSITNSPPQPYTGPAITGIVQTSAGVPVSGARVMASTARTYMNVFLDGPPASDFSGGAATTTTDGHFTLQPDSRPRAVFVRCPEGFAVATISSPAATSPSSPSTLPPLILQPWGHIDATVGPAASPGSRFECVSNNPIFGNAGIFLSFHSTAQIGSKIAFDQIPPGQFTIGIRSSPVSPNAHFYNLHVEPNHSTTVQVGSLGRSVIGRIVQPVVSFPRRSISLVQTTSSTPESLQATIDPAGTFRFDGVVPSAYRLYVQLYASADGGGMERAGDIQQEVDIPPPTPSNSVEPFDLGPIKVNIPEKFAVGQSAAPFTGSDQSGALITLSQYHGRYVLLSITTGPDGTGWADVRDLRAIHDRFAGNSSLVIFTAYTGSAIAPVRKTAIDSNITWPILDCGSSPDTLPKQYAISKHSTFIIDPNGNLLASRIDPPQACNILDVSLKASSLVEPAGIHVDIEHLSATEANSGTLFKTVTAPAADDAATSAQITVVDGALPDGPDPRACLNDGKMPANEDSRDENFRFAIGALEGRVRFDMGSVMPLSEIHSYSWHPLSRAPQLYRLYASDGASPTFDPAPKIGIDPTSRGWTLLANVDSRPASGPPGGKYAVRISRSASSLGSYRYLLFQMFPTETDDNNGNTFYSEIDVNRQN